MLHTQIIESANRSMLYPACIAEGKAHHKVARSPQEDDYRGR